MKVLVTGGAGYIGSHAVRELLDGGHEVVVLDDLSHGHRWAIDRRARFIEGSTGNLGLVIGVLTTEGIEAVLHFAANIEVAESVANPGKYYQNNVVNSLRLLTAMEKAGVKKLVFSSTAAVYGNGTGRILEETDPAEPINPYGRSKRMTELMIEDFRVASGLGYAVLRYFNVAGAHPDASIGESHHPETHLIPRILASARDSVHPVKIFGTDYPTSDGTCIRDYIHVMDLVRAHILALAEITPGQGQVYNLGSENGFTVRQVIRACERVTGHLLRVEEAPRRAGDPPILVANSRKIRERLGWKPLYPALETIVQHAWQWESTRRVQLEQRSAMAMDKTA